MRPVKLQALRQEQAGSTAAGQWPAPESMRRAGPAAGSPLQLPRWRHRRHLPVQWPIAPRLRGRTTRRLPPAHGRVESSRRHQRSYSTPVDHQTVDRLLGAAAQRRQTQGRQTLQSDVPIMALLLVELASPPHAAASQRSPQCAGHLLASLPRPLAWLPHPASHRRQLRWRLGCGTQASRHPQRDDH